MNNPFFLAVRDVIDGAKLAPLWLRLGWEQTEARFRRTLLGPFWLSANLLAISFALAFVFGGIMKVDYRSTFSLIITGILAWNLLGAVMGEASGVFISYAGLIHTQKLPLTFHIYIMMHRAFINFLAQLITVWAVLAIVRLGVMPNWQLLITVPIVIVNSFLISLIIAFPSTRFRDINQFVQFGVQILFFMTPIFWSPHQMTGPQRVMVDYNPFAHLLELIREPLLGHPPAMIHYLWAFGFMGCLAVVALTILAFFRKRLVFWL